MKAKFVEAGRPIKLQISLADGSKKEVLLTILAEIPSGSDRRVYKVKDQHGNVYAYKHAKKHGLKKEIERTEIVAKSGVPYAEMVASGTDPADGSAYVIRRWVDGLRGDDWLRSWENFGSPLQHGGASGLFLLLDALSRKGQYVGKLDPEDVMFNDIGIWVIVDCGGVREMAPRDAADRYFWKFIERWGMKLNRHGQAFANLFTLLSPLGKDFPVSPPPAREAGTRGLEKTDAELEKADIQDAGEDEDDEDEDEDDEDEDDDEISPAARPVSPLVEMDARSAYPRTVGPDGVPNGTFVGGSYERLKDGTEHINGVPTPSGSLGFDLENFYPAPLLTPLTTEETLALNVRYGKGSDGPALSPNRISLHSGAEAGSTGPQESATSTDEDSRNPESLSRETREELNHLVTVAMNKKTESQ